MAPGTEAVSASDGDTLAQKNAKHFDNIAPGPWPQWVLDLHKQITDFLVSPDFSTWAGLPPSDIERRMLDYACGDGLISKALKPLFSSAIGVDVSSSMLEKYRSTASSLGLKLHEMMCVRGDLITDDAGPTEPPLNEEELHNFDLVAISMALHHVQDPTSAMQKLACRLKSGGKLLVIDWAPVDGSTAAQREYQAEVKRSGDKERIEEALRTHAARHTVGKPEGFTRQEMEELFRSAGCCDVKWVLADRLSPVPVVQKAKGQLYWAIATKS